MAGRVECEHCGLPVPAGKVDPAASEQFCCAGCRAVYAIIRAEGYGEFYALRDSAGEQGRPAAHSGRSFLEFDDASFRDLYCRARADGLAEVALYLEGVHCSACVWLVEKVSLAIPGAVEAYLDIGRSTVTIAFDPASVQLSALARALDDVGYRPHAQRGTERATLRRKEERALLARMAIAGAIAGNVMLMSAALYSGDFAGMAPEYYELFRWGSMVLTLPAVLWSATPFFRGAWGALRSRASHMDIPISLGIIVGFLSGSYATLFQRGDVYFDSVTALIFLLLVGRWLERRQRQVAYDAAEILHSLAPSTARRYERETGAGVDVPVETLVAGDWVEVLAGDSLPVDGEVVVGSSAMDLSLLTGESRPERVGEGAKVHAGTVNLEARLLVRATETGESTRVARLVREVEAASRRRPPIVALADRLSAWFVGGVLLLALVTAALWLWLEPELALEHVVALLVVTCPCALGLATPLAVSSALGRAARAGLLVKGGLALEQLARPGLIVFDKTGTLTEGKLKLTGWVGDEAIAPWVVAAERESAHPAARAIVAALDEGAAVRAEHVEQTAGAGVQAVVDGRRLRIGHEAFVRAGAHVGAWAQAAAERVLEEARSPVLFAVDGEVKAVAALGDPPRPDGPRSLRRLCELGYELAILSGDHQRVADAVASALKVPFVFVCGGVSPEGKLAQIEHHARERTVVMVGDGVNDAAALSAASVGVAVHGGAEASLSAADVFATRAGVEPVVSVVLGARRTMAVIRRNVAFSLVYNAVGITLAMSGLIGPLLSAILMPLSSLTVITYSFRARTFDTAP